MLGVFADYADRHLALRPGQPIGDFGPPGQIGFRRIAHGKGRQHGVDLVEIDGLPATVRAGTSILRAARESGVDIPKLCATDALKPFGQVLQVISPLGEEKGTPSLIEGPDDVVEDETLRKFALYQSAPNPFNPMTTTRYDVPAAGGRR